MSKIEIIQGDCLIEKQTVELFCGTKSFSKVAKRYGAKTFTVDIQDWCEADLTKNILDIDPKELPQNPYILWASPPCTGFSVASIGKSWYSTKYHPKSVTAALGMAYVLKTIDLIRKTNPTYWFIENPRGVLRKMIFMDDFLRRTITYCQYGDTRMKPTDIWTNCTKWNPRPACSNGDTCHESAPRGSKTGTQGIKGNKDRSVVPEDIFIEIIDHIETSIDNFNDVDLFARLTE